MLKIIQIYGVKARILLLSSNLNSVSSVVRTAISKRGDAVAIRLAVQSEEVRT